MGGRRLGLDDWPTSPSSRGSERRSGRRGPTTTPECPNAHHTPQRAGQDRTAARPHTGPGAGKGWKGWERGEELRMFLDSSLTAGSQCRQAKVSKCGSGTRAERGVAEGDRDCKTIVAACSIPLQQRSRRPQTAAQCRARRTCRWMIANAERSTMKSLLRQWRGRSDVVSCAQVRALMLYCCAAVLGLALGLQSGTNGGVKLECKKGF